jgi:hypothetical protein
MSDKIIFWLDAFLLNFCLASNLQKKYDCKLYSIIDITNRRKKFFEEQKFVNFEKKWFLHDHIKKTDLKPDIEYLTNFEERYSIYIWQLGFNERLFYLYNDFYKFTQNEILYILEQECKLYEAILEEVNPDFLITTETALHHQHLFYEICKKRGVKILMLNQSKLGYKCIISQELHKIDFMPDLSSVKSKKRTFDKLLSELKSFDSSKQLKSFADNFANSKSSKLKAGFEYVFNSNNSNIETHFSYYGRSKSKVLLNYFLNSRKSKTRKAFIDKNTELEIHNDEKFILFTLNQEPERSTLIATPYYTNQLEIIRHIAKSLPPGYKLYVKEHFSQILREWRKISYYKEILEIPNVRLYHPSANIEKLIQKCSLVISIGGTTPFQAAFYQKPSIIMADLGYTVLPSIQKLNSLEELPIMIRNSLKIKVNSDDLDRYLSILSKHSFDFDWKDYEIKEGNFFSHGGNYQDTIITNNKMKSFLEENEDLFKILTDQHIKKLEQLKEFKKTSFQT